MADERAFHVLMTTDTVGGVWTHALELATGLCARGIRVTLASMGALPTASQYAQAARVPGLALAPSGYRLEWMDDASHDVRAAGDWLRVLAARLAPDIVHLNQFSFGAVPFVAPKLVVAHSCVLSWWQAVHREPAPGAFDAYRRAVAHGLAGADLVAAPTRAMLSALAEHHGHRRGGLVLPNGRDPRACMPARKLPLILSAGRFWDEAKNLGALEAVAPRLGWPVRIAGALAHPSGGTRAPRGVEVLGELAPQALAAELARAAIYALPARYEPFGQSALEAAFAGCALVLGDIPSLREIWGDAALYADPEDHAALHDALARLVGDPAMRTRLARRARERAGSFTSDRMTEAYLCAYRGLRCGACRGIPKGEETACAS